MVPKTISSRLFTATFKAVASLIALQIMFKFRVRSYLDRRVKKVQFRLPKSWYTVPPPEFLRAKFMAFSRKNGTLDSVHGFW